MEGKRKWVSPRGILEMGELNGMWGLKDRKLIRVDPRFLVEQLDG